MSDKLINLNKVLFASNICGEWEAFFIKLNGIILRCGFFDLCFCIGTIFGKKEHGLEEFLKIEKTFPVPIYYICGEESNVSFFHDFCKNGALFPNFNYLGRFGIKNIKDIRICYLSGIFNATKFQNNKFDEIYKSFYTAKDLKSVLVNFNKIDILLTTEWPENLYKNINEYDFSKLPIRNSCISMGSAVVKNLSVRCAPSLHLCCKEKIYFLPKAYLNHFQPQSTQFVGLGSFANKIRQQYLFAAKIRPLSKISTIDIINQIPPDALPCPFSIPESKNQKIITSKISFPPKGYICSICRSKEHWFSNCPQYEKSLEFVKIQKQIYDNETKNKKGCGYCYHSPGLMKHLLISVGLHVYLTISRTPIVPNHFFIVPNEHTFSSFEFNENQEKEVQLYLKCLNKAFYPQISLVFERNIKIRNHGYLEVLPIDRGQLSELACTLLIFERKFHITFHKIDQDINVKNMVGKCGFLSITMIGERYLHVIDPIKPKVRTDLLRRIVCKIIGFPDTYDYRKQFISKNEQLKLVSTIKTRFSFFDPQTEKRYSIPVIKNKRRIKRYINSDEEK